MNSKEKKIEDMTVIELESLCYRQLIILQQTQTNIQILQNEILKRNQQDKENKEI